MKSDTRAHAGTTLENTLPLEEHSRSNACTYSTCTTSCRYCHMKLVGAKHLLCRDWLTGYQSEQMLRMMYQFRALPRGQISPFGSTFGLGMLYRYRSHQQASCPHSWGTYFQNVLTRLPSHLHFLYGTRPDTAHEASAPHIEKEFVQNIRDLSV